MAGHRGMAGSAICRALKRSGYGDPAQGGALLTATREELDLLDAAAVQRWFAEHQPSVVVLAVGKSAAVGLTAWCASPRVGDAWSGSPR